MLSRDQKEEILSGFPNFKLFCENITHNKVSNNDVFYTAIPYGKKGYIWFTELNRKPICLFLHSGKNKEILDISIMDCCFERNLCHSTIIYGTQFYHEGTHFFSAEDFIYYKGSEVFRLTWFHKLKLFDTFFAADIKQTAFTNKFIVIGLPYINTNRATLVEKIPALNYRISAIQTRYFNKIGTSSYEPLFRTDSGSNVRTGAKLETPTKPEPAPKSESGAKLETPIPVTQKSTYSFKQKRDIVVFRVKPDMQNDIYHLFCIENNNFLYYDVAFIPDYTTSVMMNKLFRNIKENQNLDALEESDDEGEFEDERPDRFVDLNKEFNMNCKFNYKFKKWYPVSLANTSSNIVKKEEL